MGDGKALLPINMAYDRDEIRRKMALGPPATAEEYLLRVRLEAEDIPDIVVAPKRQKRSPQKPVTADKSQGTSSTKDPPVWHATKKSDVSLRPNRAWQTDLLASFTSMRKYLGEWDKRKNPEKRYSLPSKDDDDKWRSFCFENGGHAPTTSLLLQLDEVTCQSLFEYHVQWLTEAEEPKLQPHESLWLFALLARIDTPLTPDAEAAVRRLLVFSCALRSKMNSCGQDHDSVSLACLNTIISLTGIYFGQEEMHLR